MVDRSAINTALAKAIAYKACGNREAEAHLWAARLVELLECEGILDAGKVDLIKGHTAAGTVVPA